VEHARERYRLSERRACRLLGQWRGTQRYTPILHSDEDALRGGDCRVCRDVWTLWLSADHSAITKCRMEGGPGLGAADLAVGRAESAAETEAARTFMVGPRLRRTAAACTSELCLEL
jgi:hypothetical protein